MLNYFIVPPRGPQYRHELTQTDNCLMRIEALSDLQSMGEVLDSLFVLLILGESQS